MSESKKACSVFEEPFRDLTIRCNEISELSRALARAVVNNPKIEEDTGSSLAFAIEAIARLAGHLGAEEAARRVTLINHAEVSRAA